MKENFIEKLTGPRGGDLFAPVQAEGRRSPLNAEMIEGMPTLHRFEKDDTSREGLMNEQPWHRMAAFMMLAGKTDAQIAEVAQRKRETVNLLRSQRWFQELLAVLANETGQDIMGVLKGYALESIEGIHELAVNSENDRVRLQAYNILLEQANGKPTQKIVSENTHSLVPPDQEKAQIERELAAIRGPTQNV